MNRTPSRRVTLEARLRLDRHDEDGTRFIPVLAYTLTPVLTFRDPGGEPTSAHVSELLAHGFQLSLSRDYNQILRLIPDAGPGALIILTDHCLGSLRIGRKHVCSEQMDPEDAGDAEWLVAAQRGGKVLVISGDCLEISEAGLNLDDAAALGTLVTGNIPFLA